MLSAPFSQGEVLVNYSSASVEAWIRSLIRDVPDFPAPGVLFKDITPVLSDPAALAAGVGALAEPFADTEIDLVAAAEARGFVFGVAVAERLGVGFVPVRKPGKLPAATMGVDYELEYGQDRLEVHVDAVTPGCRLLVVDDVLATGGTASATCSLLENAGGAVVGCTFLIELTFLKGRERLAERRSESLVKFS